MESLPSDIILDILSGVPAEYVLECKLVCKNWGTLIRCSGSYFTNLHLRRQLDHLHGGADEGNDNLAAKVESSVIFACRTDDPDIYKTLLFHGGKPSDRISIDEKYIYNQNLKRIYHPPMHDNMLKDNIVGSCNGLVCTYQHHDTIFDPIYICNPLTREYIYLPKLVVKKEDVHPDLRSFWEGEVNMVNDIACGFGYVRSTNEYKVVRIHYLKYMEGTVEVYTLGSGCGWRAVGQVPYRLNTHSSGTYANDAIYWISVPPCMRVRVIVSFNLAKEEFRLLSGPPCLRNSKNQDIRGLVTLGRHLCLYWDKLRVEIWSLMKSSDSKETWRMDFDIDYEAIVGPRKHRLKFEPVLLTKNGEIIFLYHNKSALYCFDTRTTILKIVSNEASTDYLKKVQAVAHLNTFASLEAMGEPSKRYKVRPRRVRTPWDDVRPSSFWRGN